MYGELLGENYCWSILGLKGLKHSVDNQGNVEGVCNGGQCSLVQKLDYAT